MSIASVITAGFGPDASPALVVTLGYVSGNSHARVNYGPGRRRRQKEERDRDEADLLLMVNQIVTRIAADND